MTQRKRKSESTYPTGGVPLGEGGPINSRISVKVFCFAGEMRLQCARRARWAIKMSKKNDILMKFTDALRAAQTSSSSSSLSSTLSHA